MTSVSLHPTPAWGVVVREQFAAVQTALRREWIAFVAIWIVLFALSLVSSFKQTGSQNVHYGPEAGVPLILLSLLIPFSVWRGDDPAPRVYLSAMPVPRTAHTLLKVGVGLAWVFAAVAGYLLFIKALWLAGGIITGEWSTGGARAWEWIAPFTGSAIAYLAVSALVLGSRHPWRWMLAVLPTWLIGLMLSQAVGLDRTEPWVSVWNGRLGLSAAMGTNIAGADGAPSFTRWLSAVALWSATAIGLLLFSARRRLEE